MRRPLSWPTDSRVAVLLPDGPRLLGVEPVARAARASCSPRRRSRGGPRRGRAHAVSPSSARRACGRPRRRTSRSSRGTAGRPRDALTLRPPASVSSVIFFSTFADGLAAVALPGDVVTLLELAHRWTSGDWGVDGSRRTRTAAGVHPARRRAPAAHVWSRQGRVQGHRHRQRAHGRQARAHGARPAGGRRRRAASRPATPRSRAPSGARPSPGRSRAASRCRSPACWRPRASPRRGSRPPGTCPPASRTWGTSSTRAPVDAALDPEDVAYAGVLGQRGAAALGPDHGGRAAGPVPDPHRPARPAAAGVPHAAARTAPARRRARPTRRWPGATSGRCSACRSP